MLEGRLRCSCLDGSLDPDNLGFYGDVSGIFYREFSLNDEEFDGGRLDVHCHLPVGLDHHCLASSRESVVGPNRCV